MAKAIPDVVYDAALDLIATATRLVVCSAEPANFAGIAAVALADVTLTAGDGNGDWTIADGDASGRKITCGAQADFDIDSTGDADHIAWDDGSTLLMVTTCDTQTLTSGGTVSTPAIDCELADPT
jgi:hypothetical protein